MAASKVPIPRSRAHLLYLGIQGRVVALKRDTGTIAWSTRLPGGSGLASVLVEDGFVFAVSGGEVSCLDAGSGTLVWHNKLKGFGTGFAMLAGAQDPSAVAAIAAAAAAASAAAMASATAASASS